MSKRIAILQSSYIPWRGYFDIIAAVDEFVIFDDVQFTRRDWRSRNRILVSGEPRWLTIPVQSKGQYNAEISEIRIADPLWASKHWETIRHAYSKARRFNEYAPTIERAFAEAGKLERLSDVNVLLLKTVCACLSIETPFTYSRDTPRLAGNPTGRLVEICVSRGADLYLSGPSARNYIVKNEFDAAGVELTYANYAGYPEYDQGNGRFEGAVTILDALFHCGADETRGQLKSISGEAFLSPA